MDTSEGDRTDAGEVERRRPDVTMDAEQLDRALGAIVASAAGDALGAGYEFGPPVRGDVRMVGGGAFGWEPGEWTDDTQMATAVLSAAATARTTGVADVHEVAAGFLAWFAAQPKDVGNQTRSVLGRTTDPAALGDAAAAYQREWPSAAGNGGLMRTGPVAVLSLAAGGDLADTAALAEQIAELSHPHPDVVTACVLWSVAIHRAVVDGAMLSGEAWVDHVAAGLEHVPPHRHARWRELLDASRAADPAQWATTNGWVVAAFQQSLATLVTVATTPEGAGLVAALEAAVRPGGDTDTVAAITGALAGPVWGIRAVPAAWRELLHGDLVASTGVRRATVHDLEHLVRRALA